MDNEIIFNAAIVFYVLNYDIELFSSETAYGWKTFGCISGQTYYMEDELINVETACNLWCYINNRLLTKAESKAVMEANTPRLGSK